MNISTWNISLDTECPHCGEAVNLLEHSEFWLGRELDVGEHGTERSTDIEVVCPECNEEFKTTLDY